MAGKDEDINFNFTDNFTENFNANLKRNENDEKGKVLKMQVKSTDVAGKSVVLDFSDLGCKAHSSEDSDQNETETTGKAEDTQDPNLLNVNCKDSKRRVSWAEGDELVTVYEYRPKRKERSFSLPLLCVPFWKIDL